MSTRSRRRFSPYLQVLEDRTLPSTFTVTNLLDDGSAGSLRKRIEAANLHPGADTVLFKAGLTGSIPLSGNAGNSHIVISDSLTLTGPGAKKLAIDGNNNDRIFDVDDGNNIPDRNVIIQGLELRHGKTNVGGALVSFENLTLVNDLIDANQATTNGAGAIDSASGNLTIKNSTVSGNTAETGAGGVYFNGYVSVAVNFKLTIKNSTISGNVAFNGAGGGINVHGGTASITNSLISGNIAFGEGGGLYASGFATLLSITGSTIFANQADDGGGLFSNARQTTITKSTVANNSSTSDAGGGKFIGDSVNISSSNIRDNTAQGSGGGLRVSSSITLADSTVQGNFAAGRGGGLLLSGPKTSIVSGCTFADNYSNLGGAMDLLTDLTVQNSTLSGNGANSFGGAIYAFKISLTIQNSTIAFNRAGIGTVGTKGGGIFTVDGNVRLESTIVAQNRDRTGRSALATLTPNAQAQATDCLIDSVSGIVFSPDAETTELLGLDPLLAPLANNGGPTQTHALRPGSPCINKGSNPAHLKFDRAGSRSIGSSVRRWISVRTKNNND